MAKIREKVLAFIKATPGMNQSILGEKAGIPPSRLSEMLRAEYRWVNLDRTAQIARAMGVSMDWLYDPKSAWPPPEPEPVEAGGRKLSREQERILEIVEEVGGHAIAVRRLYRRPDPEEDGATFPARPLGPAPGVRKPGA